MNQVNSSKLSYRAEIDGLRAIAVVSVILYHAQMVLFGRDWFEGGFIGVDIFFVISGYLITRIILSELESKGSFSFLNFYERRARRILPMLFVVIFVSCPMRGKSSFRQILLNTLKASLLRLFFGSNFFFYFSTTEYGADSALLKPFLHTWSLGVEEQFYLVFPILAIVAFKYFRKHFLTILVGLSLLSLQFAELMEVRNSDLNFYLPFSRFWELAVGSMLAYRELYYKPSNEGFASKSLPMIGLYLIAYSILFFDAKTPHPSFHTLIPIIGVALIIGFASKDELVGKVLGSKPFVWVGLISYSAYLWHFPIFAFSRLGEELTNSDKLGLIALTFILSAASYFSIEKVFRSPALLSSRAFMKWVILSLVLVGAMAASVIKFNGFEGRFPEILGFENYEIDNRKLRKIAESYSPRTSNDFYSVDKKVLIVGDSHGWDLRNALVQSYSEKNNVDFLTVLFQTACANEDISDYSSYRDKLYNSRVYNEATTIIVASQYSTLRSCSRTEQQLRTSSDIDGLSFLIKRANSDGKKVIVIGKRTEFSLVGKLTVADQIYNTYKGDKNLAYKFDQIMDEADSLLYANRIATGAEYNIEGLVDELDADYFDVSLLACDLKRETCPAFDDDGFKIYSDEHHWTIEGAKYFSKFIKESFYDRLH